MNFHLNRSAQSHSQSSYEYMAYKYESMVLVLSWSNDGMKEGFRVKLH